MRLLHLFALCSLAVCKSLVIHPSTLLTRSNSRLRAGIADFIKREGADVKEVRVDLSKKFVTAKTEIKKGDTLISIPVDLILDSSKALTKLPEILKTERLKTGYVGLTALLLLSERLAGDKSKYYDYIESLPKGMLSVLSWSADELDELYKSTTRRIKAQVSAVEQDFNTIQRLNLFPSESFTREAFFWAVGVVKARSVYVKGLPEPVLAPGIDAIAFDPFSSAEPFLAGAGVFGGKVLKVSSERSYKQGEEVKISYGLKSSAECIEDHELVPELIDEDSSCELLLRIDESDKFANDKIGILERELSQTLLQVDLEADPSIGLDQTMMQFMRLKCIEGTDAFILEACFANTVWETMTLPFSRSNEIKALQYLIETCESSAQNMFSSPNDVEIAKGNTRKALMARLRVQERAALNGTLMKLRNEIEKIKNSPAENLEFYQERRLRQLNLDRPLDGSEIILDSEGGGSSLQGNDNF